MTIRHNVRTTRTELERVFCRWIYFYFRSKIFSGRLTGGGRDRAHRPLYRSATGASKRVKMVKVTSLTTLYTNDECQRRGNWV